jgi:hypothetical protein
MTNGEQGPVLHAAQDTMEERSDTESQSSEFSRRIFLERAIGSVAGAVLALSIKSLRPLTTERQAEALPTFIGDACAESEVACLNQTMTAGGQRVVTSAETALRSDIVYPSERIPTVTELPSPLPTEPTPLPSPEPHTHTSPLPEIASPLAQPPLKQVSDSSELSSEWDLPTAERRRMPYEEFAKNSELFLSKLPSLEILQEMFPSAFFNNVEGQLNHIQYLNESVQLEAMEFAQFEFNNSRVNAFSADGMTPRMLVWHWTGDHYETPDDIIRVLAKRGLGVQGYAHHDELAYKLVSDLGIEVSHSMGLNDFAMGLEVYSGVYDGKNSPLFSITPGVTKTALYAAVSMLRESNLTVNHSTLISHMAGDLIFGNPYYDPYNGTFHTILGRKPPHVRKFDQPQEFMNMLVAKAIELDASLSPQ